ncbi:hypothetical protein BKA93DRAFT_808478 [Sparassis latifolia]|uniref:Uncharacterized protein n=1 Tax=Sparassis crispa TaxID=139825 RepID=A0A401GAV6_9APHY|nr:hypothetical protein SCP_0205020 [Sparassis crispa]GBE79304.1 hypothetical protein SCP_0205020 [Sparassis crispa]
MVTVSASTVLPCPAGKNRFADGDVGEDVPRRRVAVVEKRPRRWIEETNPRA